MHQAIDWQQPILQAEADLEASWQDLAAFFKVSTTCTGTMKYFNICWPDSPPRQAHKQRSPVPQECTASSVQRTETQSAQLFLAGRVQRVTGVRAERRWQQARHPPTAHEGEQLFNVCAAIPGLIVDVYFIALWRVATQACQHVDGH